MVTYTEEDIVRALRSVGIGSGDTVFFTARMLAVGQLEGVVSNAQFCQAYLDAIFEVIGDAGTLVVPTYTQQVGRFGVPYFHESTLTLSGVFNEYVRCSQGAVRSFHPVFSLTALGARAEAICGRVDSSSFGAHSAYGNLFRNGGISLSLGFDRDSGHIVTGAHYLETTYGVPYYYNKVLDSDVYRNGQKTDQVFILNVAYREFQVEADYTPYVRMLDQKGCLHESVLGASKLYACDLSSQLSVGYELLADDVYAFLKHPPRFVKGEIPWDGREEKIDVSAEIQKDWSKMGLGERWVDARQQLQPA